MALFAVTRYKFVFTNFWGIGTKFSTRGHPLINVTTDIVVYVKIVFSFERDKGTITCVTYSMRYEVVFSIIQFGFSTFGDFCKIWPG